jgi:hypothetical protein
MRLPSAIAAGSVAIGVFVAGFAIGHGVSDDSSPSKKTASGTPKVLEEVFGRNPDASTTTTAVALAPGAPSPSTTAQPSAGSQSTATAAQVTSSPATTPATVVVGGACGTGTTSAKAASQTFPRSKAADTDYETDVVASVHNGVDRPIQIDTLSIRLNYEDGGVQDVVLNGAIGSVVQPGSTANYSVALNTGKRPVRSTNLQSFASHTEGHPECTGRPA